MLSMSPFARAVRALFALAMFAAAYANWANLPLPANSGGVVDGVPMSNPGMAYVLFGLALAISVFANTPKSKWETKPETVS